MQTKHIPNTRKTNQNEQAPIDLVKEKEVNNWRTTTASGKTIQISITPEVTEADMNITFCELYASEFLFVRTVQRTTKNIEYTNSYITNINICIIVIRTTHRFLFKL